MRKKSFLRMMALLMALNLLGTSVNVSAFEGEQAAAALSGAEDSEKDEDSSEDTFAPEDSSFDAPYSEPETGKELPAAEDPTADDEDSDDETAADDAAAAKKLS
jgi:hypothetical protein